MRRYVTLFLLVMPILLSMFLPVWAGEEEDQVQTKPASQKNQLTAKSWWIFILGVFLATVVGYALGFFTRPKVMSYIEQIQNPMRNCSYGCTGQTGYLGDSEDVNGFGDNLGIVLPWLTVILLSLLSLTAFVYLVYWLTRDVASTEEPDEVSISPKVVREKTKKKSKSKSKVKPPTSKKAKKSTIGPAKSRSVARPVASKSVQVAIQRQPSMQPTVSGKNRPKVGRFRSASIDPTAWTKTMPPANGKSLKQPSQQPDVVMSVFDKSHGTQTPPTGNQADSSHPKSNPLNHTLSLDFRVKPVVKSTVGQQHPSSIDDLKSRGGFSWNHSL